MNKNTLIFHQQELASCKSVQEWNEKINQVQDGKIRAYIESSGLIVKILGMDAGQPIYSN